MRERDEEREIMSEQGGSWSRCGKWEIKEARGRKKG